MGITVVFFFTPASGVMGSYSYNSFLGAYFAPNLHFSVPNILGLTWTEATDISDAPFEVIFSVGEKTVNTGGYTGMSIVLSKGL